MSESIFEAAATTPGYRTPSWHDPRGLGMTPRPAAATVRTSTTIASSHDAALIGILDAPLAAGESAHAGFARKEAALRAAFARLPVSEARTLLARLTQPRPGDALAARLARLTAERRARLLTFLADARRREAQAATKGK